MRPLFWVSGLFFTVEEVPQAAQAALLFNPVLHTVELVREGWFASYESPGASVSYVLYFALAFLTAGLLLERIVRRKIELS
jgi:capsular polysaccharide transport system permease protein